MTNSRESFEQQWPWVCECGASDPKECIRELCIGGRERPAEKDERESGLNACCFKSLCLENARELAQTILERDSARNVLARAIERERLANMRATEWEEAAQSAIGALTFDEFRRANVARCIKWHPAGIASWSPSDWLTAVTGELGELASLLKMRNRERDGLPGNKFSPTNKQIADELADVLTYLDLLAEVMGVDLGRAAVEKFNEVSERVGFPDRLRTTDKTASDKGQG